MNGAKLKKTLGIILINIFLTALALTILIPIVWMLLSSIKPSGEITAFPPRFFPRNFSLENYRTVFELVPIGRYFLNTVLYAAIVSVVSLLFNSLAGYAFARMQFKGKNILFTILLASMMIPFQVIMIPVFMEISLLGLYDTYPGLVIPKFAAVIGIFFFRSYFTTLPKQLEEAARVDGLSEIGIFFRIMLPLSKSAIMTQLVLTVNSCWNDLLWPLLMTSSGEKRMLSNGIISFVGQQNTIKYGPAFALGIISVAPIFILFVFGQKYFINSIVSTGLKDG